ncbi:MAG: hypothetical protein WBZ37_30610 [Mycobacterium sp.]
MTTIDRTNRQTPQARTTSESQQESISLAPASDIATAASAPASKPKRRSRFAWLGATVTDQRYHHPQRERFVEEAAMSREMFRL